jgi:hypothetical protein
MKKLFFINSFILIVFIFSAEINEYLTNYYYQLHNYFYNYYFHLYNYFYNWSILKLLLTFLVVIIVVGFSTGIISNIYKLKIINKK